MRLNTPPYTSAVLATGRAGRISGAKTLNLHSITYRNPRACVGGDAPEELRVLGIDVRHQAGDAVLGPIRILGLELGRHGLPGVRGGLTLALEFQGPGL